MIVVHQLANFPFLETNKPIASYCIRVTIYIASAVRYATRKLHTIKKFPVTLCNIFTMG